VSCRTQEDEVAAAIFKAVGIGGTKTSKADFMDGSARRRETG